MTFDPSAPPTAPTPAAPPPWPSRPAAVPPAFGGRVRADGEPASPPPRRAPVLRAPPRPAPAPLQVWDDERAHAAHLEQLLGQCRRQARPAALLLAQLLPPADDAAALAPLLGRRLRARVRATDAVARLGATHFSVLLFDIDARHVPAVALRLAVQLGEPCALPDGRVLRPALRIGCALPGRDGRHADELLRVATLTAR